MVSANDFPGSDLGAKINAADKALGTSPGEITVKGGGTISTQVIISSDHVLRFMPGTYVTKTTNIPILMKSAFVGGWLRLGFNLDGVDRAKTVYCYLRLQSGDSQRQTRFRRWSFVTFR